MHLSLESLTGNLSLEVDSLDTFDVIEAKIKDMGNNLNIWHINWESSPQIFVRDDVTGNTISVKYKCSYTISHLKSKIRSKIGIVPDRQILFFAGKPLEERFTLSDYNISQGSTLDIAFVFGGGLMRLSVMDTSGMSISVEIYKIYPVSHLKALIYKQIGKPECKQRLVNFHAGEELLDTNILAFYLIQNGATLHLVDDTWMKSTNEMKVNVKIGPTGKTVQLDVLSCDTIKSVKSMIQEKEHIPICLQVLYLPQKRLEDTFTLAHYYILNEATIYLAQIPCEIRPAAEARLLWEAKAYHEGTMKENTLNKEGSPPKHQRLNAESSRGWTQSTFILVEGFFFSSFFATVVRILVCEAFVIMNI